MRNLRYRLRRPESQPVRTDQLRNPATRQNAFSKGHHLVVSGVTWDDEPALATLSEGIAARDLQNVVLMAEQHAVGALAQTVGRALERHHSSDRDGTGDRHIVGRRQ